GLSPKNARYPGIHLSKVAGTSPAMSIQIMDNPSLQPACFLGQHDRDAVADRIGELGLAGDQLLFGRVIFKRPFGDRAHEDFQQFRIDAVWRPFGRRDSGSHDLLSAISLHYTLWSLTATAVHLQCSSWQARSR